jgi:hypothetical protein
MILNNKIIPSSKVKEVSERESAVNKQLTPVIVPDGTVVTTTPFLVTL